MYKKIRTYYFFILLSIFGLLSSCDNVYNENIHIQNNKWNYNDSLNFEVNITETTQPFNVFIDINNNDAFKYSNLYLFISIKSPDNNIITDTVDVLLADYKGKWYGNEKGNDYEGHYLYKRAILFPKHGIYTFSVKHGMRDDIVNGISLIGISIENFKE